MRIVPDNDQLNEGVKATLSSLWHTEGNPTGLLSYCLIWLLAV